MHLRLTIGRFFDGCHSGPNVESDAAALERSAQALGHVLVKTRQHLGRVFHHRHLCAKTAEDAGKLQSDDTAANHAEVARHFRTFEKGGGVYNLRDLGSGNGERTALAARGYDDMGCGEGLFALGCADAQGMVINEACRALQKGDARRAHQRLNALAKGGNHLILARDDGGEIDLRHSALGQCYTIVVALAEGICDFGTAAQRLGGDTSFAQTSAA